MMTVVGEEGTSIEDFTVMLKAEFVDACYLQQNAYDPVDGATPADRQTAVFGKLLEVVDAEFGFADRGAARKALVEVSELFRNWNYAAEGSAEYRSLLERIDGFLATRCARA